MMYNAKNPLNLTQKKGKSNLSCVNYNIISGVMGGAGAKQAKKTGKPEFVSA